MNVIRKHETGYNAGHFVLHRPNGQAICQLGERITVFVRRIVSQPRTRNVTSIKYVVEVKESLIHKRDEAVSSNSLAVLEVPITGSDCRISLAVLKGDGMGAEHRVGLQQYVVGDKTGYVMTIDGLLWDGRIIHVKDIAA